MNCSRVAISCSARSRSRCVYFMCGQNSCKDIGGTRGAFVSGLYDSYWKYRLLRGFALPGNAKAARRRRSYQSINELLSRGSNRRRDACMPFLENERPSGRAVHRRGPGHSRLHCELERSASTSQRGLVRCLRPNRRYFPALRGRSADHCRGAGPRARQAIPYPCLYFVAITSLEFMSMVMVHPEVPLNSNGAGLGPRR